MEQAKDMPPIESILWRGFVLPGHEACRLFSRDARWHLEGTALFSHEQQPCRLDYQVTCDATTYRYESAGGQFVAELKVN